MCIYYIMRSAMAAMALMSLAVLRARQPPLSCKPSKFFNENSWLWSRKAKRSEREDFIWFHGDFMEICRSDLERCVPLFGEVSMGWFFVRCRGHWVCFKQELPAARPKKGTRSRNIFTPQSTQFSSLYPLWLVRCAGSHCWNIVKPSVKLEKMCRLYTGCRGNIHWFCSFINAVLKVLQLQLVHVLRPSTLKFQRRRQAPWAIGLGPNQHPIRVVWGSKSSECVW